MSNVSHDRVLISTGSGLKGFFLEKWTANFEWSRLIFIVITSYSIHYTKLYDERAGKKRERDNRPIEVVQHRFLKTVSVRGSRHEIAERKVEKIELHEGRGVAKKLDVTLHDALGPDKARALQPGADHTDDDREDQTGRRQLDGGEYSMSHAGAIEGIVADRVIDRGVVV